MGNAILHISDLHFTSDYKITRFDGSGNFQTKLINSLKGIEQKIKYLVVSGDIANASNEDEYKTALIFLNEIISAIPTLEKKNVIICPGNHDVSWSVLKNLSDIEDTVLFTKQEDKFQFFIKFYNEFFAEQIKEEEKKKFDVNSAVHDEIIDKEDKIILLGVNTCYKSSCLEQDQIGFIMEKSFNSHLKQLYQSLQYNDYGKFLVMHHNPKSLSNQKPHLENWDKLNKNSIGYPFVVLCGHIHGADGEATVKNDTETMYYVSVGSLTKNSIENTFNIYSNIEQQSLNILYYALQDKDNPTQYSWANITTTKDATKTIKFRADVNQSLLEPNPWDTKNDDIAEGNKQDLDRWLSKEKIPLLEKEKQNQIILDLPKFIKRNELFKSGHFHWKNGFRTHGYIDINFLVSRKESLELITKHFYNKIISNVGNDLQNTLILAIGMECNVIGARLSALLPYHYSYIPDPAQNNDFGKIEIRIMADKENENNINKYDNIILLKDIIFEAEHTKDLLRNLKLSDKNIHLLSIFYCGEQNKESELFKGDEDFRNMKFYSICNEIAVEKCKYSGEKCDKKNSKCTIYSNDLQFIYEC